MDDSENITLEYLELNGYKPVFEPDGNIPPDFKINDTAVEVRRLNQNYFTKNNIKGLEEVSIPLWQKIESLIKKINIANHTESWHVTIDFSRPLGKLKNISQEIEKGLLEFSKLPDKQSPYKISCKNYNIELYKASKTYDTYFICSAQDDLDSGGLVATEMLKNIEYCINEKSRIIKDHRIRYDKWWLVLVDRISYDLSDYEISELRSNISLPPDWEKLIIINPNNLKRSIEI